MKPYHNGPIPNEDRKCTDIVFLVLFIALSVIIFGFAIYGWAAGHLHDLKTPYDPDGKACGKDFPDHRFIYFASPHHDSLNVTTCVKSCPKEGDTELDCQVNSMVQTCQATNNANNLKAVEIYDSDDALNSFCHPTSDVIYEQIKEALEIEKVDQILSSLKKTWVVIVLSAPLAIIFSLIFILIVRFTGSIFVYILIVTSVVGLIGFGVFLLAIDTDSLPETIRGHSKVFQIIVGVICILLGVAITIMFICYRRKIQLAATIVECSARFVGSHATLLLVALVLFVILIVWLIIWFLEAAALYSLGERKDPHNGYPYQTY